MRVKDDDIPMRLSERGLSDLQTSKYFAHVSLILFNASSIETAPVSDGTMQKVPYMSQCTWRLASTGRINNNKNNQIVRSQDAVVVLTENCIGRAVQKKLGSGRLLQPLLGKEIFLYSY